MDPVSFAVVGLGMGRGRSRLVKETEGARLAMVVDIDKERAQGVGEELDVPWALSIDEALARDEIECIFVLTPSGCWIQTTGVPVSWQIGAVWTTASSTLLRIVPRALSARLSCLSRCCPCRNAATTSAGSSVDALRSSSRNVAAYRSGLAIG